MSIWNFILSIDLREILYAAIGAFFGFWLALILEKNSERKSKEELIETSLKNLIIELKEIEEALKNSNANQKLIIDIPIYEASVQSGNILVFVEKKYYIDLLKTYSSIKMLIRKEEQMSAANSNQLDLEMRSQSRMEFRISVQNTIEEFLNSVENIAE